jgi:hypothetical protein
VEGNALPVEGHKDINFVLGGGYLPVGETYLVKVVTTSDPRLKVLMGKDMVSRMGKNPGKGVSYCLNALTCLTADLYRIVQILLPVFLVL